MNDEEPRAAFDPATDPVVKAVLGDGPADFTGIPGLAVDGLSDAVHAARAMAERRDAWSVFPPEMALILAEYDRRGEALKNAERGADGRRAAVERVLAKCAWTEEHFAYPSLFTAEVRRLLAERTDETEGGT